MTDHAEKMAEALERIEDIATNGNATGTNRLAIARIACETLAAYRAQQEQAGAATWTQEQVERVDELAARLHGKVRPRPVADDPTEPQARAPSNLARHLREDYATLARDHGINVASLLSAADALETLKESLKAQAGNTPSPVAPPQHHRI